MHDRATPRAPRTRSRRAGVIAGALAVAGMALTASASGGLGGLGGGNEGDFCKVVRDCVYGQPPDTHIQSGPIGYTDDPTPRFEFSSNKRHVGYECRLDGHPFHACANPYVSYPLDDGEHRLDARAVDAQGNVDPTPDSLEFQVDTHCPSTEIENDPGHVVHGDDASFSFGSSDHHARFHVDLNGKTLARHAGSHLKLHGLRRGRYVLSVTAVDRAGNSDNSASRFRFTVRGKHHRHGHRHGHHGSGRTS
jgi:hypothetical protein